MQCYKNMPAIPTWHQLLVAGDYRSHYRSYCAVTTDMVLQAWCLAGFRMEQIEPRPCAMWWSQHTSTDGNPWKTWGTLQPANGHPPVPAHEYSSCINQDTCFQQIPKGAINWKDKAGFFSAKHGILIYLFRGQKFLHQCWTPCLFQLLFHSL